MIVCDVGDHWQVVMQTDHADLSGELARRWADRTERPESLTIAAERHDDGWAVWEQSPAYDPGANKPVNFLDVNVLAHLAFYRAGIAAITEQDPYAGLLVSMHGAGIYRRRYGLQPELQLTFADGARQQVDAFVAEQEGGVRGQGRRARRHRGAAAEGLRAAPDARPDLAPVLHERHAGAGRRRIRGIQLPRRGCRGAGDEPVPVRRAASSSSRWCGGWCPSASGPTGTRSATNCSRPSPSGRRSRSGRLR